MAKVSALHHCDSPSNKYSCVLLTCVGCAVPAKFLMDKDFSVCVYIIDNVNLMTWTYFAVATLEIHRTPLT